MNNLIYQCVLTRGTSVKRINIFFAILIFLLSIQYPVMAFEVQPPKPGHFVAPFDTKRGVLTYSDLVEKTRDAVVRVDNWQTVKSQKNTPQLIPVGNGSGAIIDNSRGYIVTNFHVVEKAEALSILLADGRHFETKLIGTDPFCDLAVLQFEGILPKALPFADSRTIKVGDVVFSAGSPVGLDFSFSQGIISALDRGIDKGFGAQAYIQTDAGVNHGNSGGPLLDTQGRIVGINTLKREETDGIGFSIPAKTVIHVVQRLIETGRIERGVTGERGGNTITTALAAERHLPVSSGYELESPLEGFPLFNAGLRKGDIVTGVGEDSVDNALDFVCFNNLIEIKNSYPIIFYRDGLPYRTEIYVDERFNLKQFQIPDDQIGDAIKQAMQFYDAFDAVFTLQPLRLDHQDLCHGISMGWADKNGFAVKIGMQVGDILEQIGNIHLNEPSQLTSINTRSSSNIVYCREGKRFTRHH